MIFQPERTHCCRLQRHAFDNTKTNSARRRLQRARAHRRRRSPPQSDVFGVCFCLQPTKATHMHVIMIMPRSPSRKASAAALVINNIRAAALNTSAGRKKFERRVHVRLQPPRGFILSLSRFTTLQCSKPTSAEHAACRRGSALDLSEIKNDCASIFC